MLERCMIAAVKIKKERCDLNYQIEELNNLVKAAGGEVIASIIQEKDKVDNRLYFGKGKVTEIKNLIEQLDIEVLVINNELSPSQLRNLDEILQIKIIDRTGLILDIFALRAKTKESKFQVELAQLKYKLPKLKGQGISLSKLAGGIGTRGPGETKLESDRRHIEKRILQIESNLVEINKNRNITRKKRSENSIPVISIVGYTNSGKSTLINTLLKRYGVAKEKTVFTYDMLFATLTTENRKILLEDKFSVIITDTVGFVSQLPTLLVESFKSTLEEAKYSDMMIHLIDLSSKDFKYQKSTTEKILKEINALDIPRTDVYNKVDLTDIDDYNDSDLIYISAEKEYNIERLIDKLLVDLFGEKTEEIIKISPDNWKEISFFEKYSDIISREYNENETIFKVIIRKKVYKKHLEGVNEY